ncbi:MAG: MFS transporter [Gemmataceae bacterium]|nr:MFS transporter [Gemmataceae bacterium]
MATSPSRVRYAVLFLLCLLAMITYMDRAANGSAKSAIMADLNANRAEDDKYSTEDFFLVLMAFQLAYALFEVPSGWLGDTHGPRAALLRVVTWWSLFVFLTGFTGMRILSDAVVGGIYIGFGALIVIQFLFGMGEAGAFPNISKALYNWFPADSRGFAKSCIWMSARLMGGLTPLLWVSLTSWDVGGMHQSGGLTWRGAMWLFALIAALWSAIFYLFFKNKPKESTWVNEAELALINAGRNEKSGPVRIPWGKLLRSRNLWALCGMYMVTNFCWYFLMYNHPGAMKSQFPDWNNTPEGRILLAILSGAPLLVGMLGCFLGGVLSDRYIRRTGDRKWGRRIYGMLGYGAAGVCYLIAIAAKVVAPDNVWALAIPLMLMGFFNDLIMAPAWAVCQDIGRDYAATVSGAMNMVGNLGGAVTGIFVTGMILRANSSFVDGKEVIATTGYITCFTLYAIVYFCGVGLWLLIDATKPIESEPSASSQN